MERIDKIIASQGQYSRKAVKALIAKIPSDASAERPDYRGASRASAVYRCPVCGRLIRSGESYCPDCGMRL